MSNKFIFEFTEQHAGSTIRPEYEDRKQRTEEIKANSFQEAIKKLRRILSSSRKNCFYDFLVNFDGFWHRLAVDDSTVKNVFEFSIYNVEFSIVN